MSAFLYEFIVVSATFFRVSDGSICPPFTYMLCYDGFLCINTTVPDIRVICLSSSHWYELRSANIQE